METMYTKKYICKAGSNSWWVIGTQIKIYICLLIQLEDILTNLKSMKKKTLEVTDVINRHVYNIYY